MQPKGRLDGRKDASRPKQTKELSEETKIKLMEVINSKKYCDLPPCKIVPLLADEGCYIASESTIYRILRKERQLTHRTKSKSKKHSKPQSFVASKPNQVWSWDISYLPTTVRGIYFYLYMVVDIYSRKIIGWSIHDVQSSDYSSKLIKQCCLDENVHKEQLVLHSDNGKPMKGATMLATLEKLGVKPSFSRPSVSDDNPYSESLFKTVKYHSTYPDIEKFESIDDARTWMEKFSTWYNNEHLHSGIKYVTPMQRHTGKDIKILQNRHKVYQEAKKCNPGRWSGSTRNWIHCNVVYLNPKKNKDAVSKMDGALSKVSTRNIDASVSGSMGSRAVML